MFTRIEQAGAGFRRHSVGSGGGSSFGDFPAEPASPLEYSGKRQVNVSRRGSTGGGGRRGSLGGAGKSSRRFKRASTDLGTLAQKGIIAKSELQELVMYDTQSNYARLARLQAYDSINEMIPLYNVLRFFGTPEKIDEHIQRASELFDNFELVEQIGHTTLKAWLQVFLHYAIDTTYGPFLDIPECATLVRALIRVRDPHANRLYNDITDTNVRKFIDAHPRTWLGDDRHTDPPSDDEKPSSAREVGVQWGPRTTSAGNVSGISAETGTTNLTAMTGAQGVLKPKTEPTIGIVANDPRFEKTKSQEDILGHTDNVDATQFLMVCMHFYNNRSGEAKATPRAFLSHIWSGIDAARKKPLELLKDTVLALYDEQIFPEDDFSRRAKMAISRKEVPKEGEWYIRAMEMLLALQERTIVAKHQSGDLHNDLEKWIQLFVVFSSCRQDEVEKKFREKETLIEQVRHAQEEMEVILMKLQEETTLQTKIISDWKREARVLKEDRQVLKREVARMEHQMQIDRKNCAEFMSGMLQKDHQLHSLAKVIPQYSQIQKEISMYEEENEVMHSLLTEAYKSLNKLLPEQSQTLEKTVLHEMAIEQLIYQTLETYDQAIEISQRRVEDVLPYLKVVQRPGGYEYYRAPGEPTPSAPTSEKQKALRRLSIKLGLERGSVMAMESVPRRSIQEMPKSPNAVVHS